MRPFRHLLSLDTWAYAHYTVSKDYNDYINQHNLIHHLCLLLGLFCLFYAV
jgi:hypothetical protein